MGFDKEKIKQIYKLVLFIAIVVLVLIYSKNVFYGLQLFVGMIVPFLAGGAIAFVLNIPLRAIEKKWLKKWDGKVASKLKRPLSMVLSIVFIALIVTFVIYTAVPAIKETVAILKVQIPIFIQRLLNWAEQLAADYPEILEKVRELENMEIDWDAMIGNVTGFLSSGMGNVLSSAFSVASSIIGGVVNGFIAFVFAIYILSQKEKLTSQGKRVLHAFLNEKQCKKATHILKLLYKNFSNFITGQCIEAVILGCMFVLVLSIFQFKYALLIGVLIAFLSLIPIVGAFVGCFISAFLLLMDDPMRALWFIVIFLILQQIEGNLIYPYVVGGSVGLPSIWVLAAVSIGGSLMGVLGMLCFIPLVATGYSLLRESVNERNHAKRLLAEAAHSGPGVENHDRADGVAETACMAETTVEVSDDSETVEEKRPKQIKTPVNRTKKKNRTRKK